MKATKGQQVAWNVAGRFRVGYVIDTESHPDGCIIELANRDTAFARYEKLRIPTEFDLRICGYRGRIEQENAEKELAKDRKAISCPMC